MSARRGYVKGEQRREAILDTVLGLFAQDSYRHYTLRDIARECDISLAGLMHHFESKDELYVAVLRRRDLRAVESLHAEDRAGSLVAVVDRNVAEPGLIELYVAMTAAAADPSHPAAEYMTGRFTRLITEAVAAEPEREPRRVEHEARILIAILDGLQQQWLVNRRLNIAQRVSDYLRAHHSERFPE